MSEAIQRKSITRILRGGARVRVRRPGETDAEKQRWQDKLVERGFPSIVFDHQSTMDDYIARVKAGQKRTELRDRLERQYRAGELVRRRTKASHGADATA